MEKAVAVLCVLVLGITATDGVVEILDVEIPGIKDKDNGGGGNGGMSTITSVSVPERTIGEAVLYDHIIRIESKWENKSSGEYWFWALDVWGTHTMTLVGTTTKPDGFGELHNVLHEERQLGAMFTVYSDSSDGEEIQAGGDYDIQRDEYTDLNLDKDLRKIILTETDAYLRVDELPSTNIPLEFDGYMRSYFDVWEEKTETLEESVLGDDRYIEVGDDGDYGYSYDYGSGIWEIPYTWKAEHGEKIAGYETIFINVTSDLGTENFSIPFQQKLWFADEVSVPVKEYINTSTFFDGENESFYLIIENDFTLQEGGYTPGDQDIPWGECTNHPWVLVHPLAEFDSWVDNYMPRSGTEEEFDDSSFDFRTEDAVNFLTTKDPDTNDYPSPDLMDFLNLYSDSMVTNAEYSADPINNEYWWNLTFGRKRADDEDRSVKCRYQLLVRQESTWVLLPEPHYENEFFVEEDYGLKNGSSEFSPDEISSQVATLASSEDVLKTDDKVIEFFYTNAIGQEEDELRWGDIKGISYSLQTSGWEAIGMDLLGTLTGIQTQTTSRYYWTVMKEDLSDAGTMASASIDAETGRLISILEIDGTALKGAFSD